jgi:hypothetical protein
VVVVVVVEVVVGSLSVGSCSLLAGVRGGGWGEGLDRRPPQGEREGEKSPLLFLVLTARHSRD